MDKRELPLSVLLGLYLAVPLWHSVARPHVAIAFWSVPGRCVDLGPEPTLEPFGVGYVGRHHRHGFPPQNRNALPCCRPSRYHVRVPDGGRLLIHLIIGGPRSSVFARRIVLPSARRSSQTVIGR